MTVYAPILAVNIEDLRERAGGKVGVFPTPRGNDLKRPFLFAFLEVKRFFGLECGLSS